LICLSVQDPLYCHLGLTGLLMFMSLFSKTTLAALSCSILSMFSRSSAPLSHPAFRLSFRRCHFRFAFAKLVQKNTVCKFCSEIFSKSPPLSVHLVDNHSNQKMLKRVEIC